MEEHLRGHGYPRAVDEVPTRDATLSDTEADEMKEHLRGLGYLE